MTKSPRTGAGEAGAKTAKAHIEHPTSNAQAKECRSTKSRASWRDVLPVHPAAEPFPPFSKDDLEALSKDIKQHGLHQRCRFVEDENGRRQLVDGINRLDALEHGGEEIT